MERLRDPARAGGESGGSRLGVRVEEKGWAGVRFEDLGEERGNSWRDATQQLALLEATNACDGNLRRGALEVGFIPRANVCVELPAEAGRTWPRMK